MPSPAPADGNLIFGLLALQMDLLTREQLLEALHAWMLQRQTPLADILVRRGVLGRDDRDDLDRLVARHVRRHGDPRASLAALRVEPSVRQGLEIRVFPRRSANRMASAVPNALPNARSTFRSRPVTPNATGWAIGELRLAGGVRGTPGGRWRGSSSSGSCGQGRPLTGMAALTVARRR
jgi:hypothetical protein